MAESNDETKPSFSVIIPSHNVEGYILQTLASVFAQDYREFEVILVDDHSTDRTVKLVSESEYPVQIFASAGKGAGAARNHGARHAKGNYLCFLDSDDIWFPWALRTFSMGLTEHSDASWLIGRSTRFQDARELETRTATEGYSGLDPEFRKLNNFASTFKKYIEVHTGTQAIRREVFFRAGGYDESLKNLEDGELYLKLSEVSPLILIKRPILLGYRNRHGSTSSLQQGLARDCFTVYNRARSGAYASTGAVRRRQSIIASRYLRPSLIDLIVKNRKGEFLFYWISCFWSELRLGHLKFLFGSLAMYLFHSLRPKRHSTTREDVCP